MSGNAPVTSEETRIILSFAMADHGGQFAHWLRDKLMKKFNYYARNNVYMDCVATRGLETVHTEKPVKREDQVAGVTYVTPDTRPHFKAQGYMPIGATNSDWNGMYLTAMSQAKAMIMILTPSYLNSEWCMKEWLQFQDERRKRGDAFLGIAMRFTDSASIPLTDTVTKEAKKFMGSMKAPGGIPLNMTGIKSLLFPKAYGVGGLLWHEKDFGISETHLATIYETLGDHH